MTRRLRGERREERGERRERERRQGRGERREERGERSYWFGHAYNFVLTWWCVGFNS